MIHCLPGFLGRASDWDAFATACARRGLPQVRAVPLFEAPPADGSLEAWATRFTDTVRATDNAPRLVGYSLGGRLALHALLAAPWRAAVIVSAHTGLSDPAERVARCADDANWAERFARDAWDPLVNAWNAQPVFGGRPQTAERPEAAYHREALVHALRAWSLGCQKPLAARLSAIQCPVLWIVGADDPRFLAQGELAVQYLPQGSLAVAPGAGHRVPWEAADWFHDTVTTFFAERA